MSKEIQNKTFRGISSNELQDVLGHHISPSPQFLNVMKNSDLDDFRFVVNAGLNWNHDVFLKTSVLLGKKEVFEFLFEAAGRTNKKLDERIYSESLIKCTEIFHLDMMKWLLEKGADPNFQECAALKVACQLRFFDSSKAGEYSFYSDEVQKSIKYKIHQGGYNEAYIEPSLDAIKLLVKYGAKINPEGYRPPNILKTVAESGNLEVLKWVFEAGDFQSYKNKNKNQMLRAAIAASQSSLECLRFLIDVGLGNEYGEVLSAAICENKQKHPEILEYLSGLDFARGYRLDAAAKAIELKNLEAFEVLIKKDINFKADATNYFLYPAIKKDSIDILKYILKRVDDPKILNSILNDKNTEFVKYSDVMQSMLKEYMLKKQNFGSASERSGQELQGAPVFAKKTSKSRI